MCEVWSPTDDHLALCAEVEQLVTKWRERLPWLTGWKITVEAVPIESDDYRMSIVTTPSLKGAIIQVCEGVTDDDSEFFHDDEYTLELVVLHELCHVLMEPMRIVTMGWDDDLRLTRMFNQEEETAVWTLCRTLQQLDRDQAKLRNALQYAINVA